jgi:hemerythrin superfamily protein
METIAERPAADPVGLAAALAAGKKVRPDVISLLKDDHRTVLGWFDWYRQSDADDPVLRKQIALKICFALRAHMAAEEEIFYPAAKRFLRDDDLVTRAFDDHAAAKDLVEQIEETPASKPRHADLLLLLEEEIRTHVEEEETVLMPRVRNSKLDVYETGAAVAARRVETMLELRRGAA